MDLRMKKIILGLTLLFLSGCYQTLKSSYPYESCLAHASGSIPFIKVQDCAQRAVSAWQSQNPNLRVERNLYLDAYVNDLVDQVRRGQVSDPKARLMFAEKVIEIERNIKREKEEEIRKVQENYEKLGEAWEKQNRENNERVCRTERVGTAYETVCKDRSPFPWRRY